MTAATLTADAGRMPEHDAVRRYARTAGVLFLLTIAGGFTGELYIPSRLIEADAATTAQNILGSQQLFRLGFAAYLVEALCDIALSWVLYVLLRPVHPNLSLLAAFLGLVSTAIYAVAEIFYFASLVILTSPHHLTGFSPEQIHGLARVSLRLFGTIAGIFMAIYGIASVIRGYLIYRSGYLPRLLGVLLMVAGTGFILRNVTLVLAPAYTHDAMLAPMLVTILSLSGWFLVKGVDTEVWVERASRWSRRLDA